MPEFPPAGGPSVEPKGIAPTTPIQRSSERRPLERSAVSNLNAARAEKSNENEQRLDFPLSHEVLCGSTFLQCCVLQFMHKYLLLIFFVQRNIYHSKYYLT